VDGSEWLLERFEASRGRLRSVAYRMLGSYHEADDAVQDTWLQVVRFLPRRCFSHNRDS
jgi:RNA polymerase sigma-70 factor (ECF subfamily)